MTQAAAAQDVPVDLELILAVDVSGSMDLDEKRLQREGYIAALQHPQVIEAITAGAYGRIALAYVEWAGPLSQSVIIPWRLIDGAEAAAAVAAELAMAPTVRIRGTSISGALAYTAPLFDDNGYEGFRLVIDVSGDGANNMGPPVAPVRDMALAKGIVINGLPIMVRPSEGDFLAIYYEDCVIGGPGAFVVPVWSWEQFGEATRRKMVLEIAGRVPEPALIPATFQTPRVDCLIGERSRPEWLLGEPPLR